MTKRQKFVVSSLLLTVGYGVMVFSAFTLFAEPFTRYLSIFVLSLFAALLTWWCLRESLGWNATLLTLVGPALFTEGIGMFYFLIPERVPQLISTTVILILYAIGIYALFLTSNIYTVAAARTIALLRAAHAVGFLLTLLTVFLLLDTLFSLKLGFLVNGVGAGLISFPLLLQGFWSIDLGHKLNHEVLNPAIVGAVVTAQSAVALSFWPISVPVAALALTTVSYVCLGLGQAKIQQRLFSRTIREYFLVGAVVFLTMFLTARWAG